MFEEKMPDFGNDDNTQEKEWWEADVKNTEEIIGENNTESESVKEVIDEAIEGDPRGFLSWFANLKNSITDLPKSLLENKTVKNAIIYASIPFAVLSAARQEVRAEDIISEFTNQSAISEEIKTEDFRERIKADDLIAVEDQNQREVLAQKINLELSAFDKLSDPFNDATKENPDLFPKEIMEKIAQGEKVFNFSYQMQIKINEANDYFKEISSEENSNKKEEKQIWRNRKFLENGGLNFKELIKAFPEIVTAGTLPFLYHEIAGHEKTAAEQGVAEVQTAYKIQDIEKLFYRLSLLKGHGTFKFTENAKDVSAINAAGINASKKFGEFLTDNLRGDDNNSQLLAIMALIAKSDGMRYALSTHFSPDSQARKEASGNDITYYAKNTGVSVSELALGLTADFLLDKDNWDLMGIAMGKDGIKIPEATIAPFYELGDQGPMMGIKLKGVF